MKIAFFTDTYKPQINGVVKSIEFFSEELEKRGHDIYIFCPKGKNVPKEEKIYPLKSFKFKPYPEYRIGIPSPNVIKLIKKIKPDIVHIHGPASVGLIGLSVAKYKKIPVVMTYHTSLLDYIHYITKRKKFEEYSKKIIEKYIKWFFNKADLIIAPSYPIKKLLIGYGIRKKIKVLPTGIKIKNTKKQKKFNKKTLLHVGRVTKEKNIGDILKSFKNISEKMELNLIIASDGPYINELKKTTKSMKLKNIKF
ncbi:MAG: glycosyltransferase, partial [Candidatus Aenigmarchaeota archaeon]|nr:glycosyltransferase [Candidatus Aenigmarchaeota archaeon]